MAAQGPKPTKDYNERMQKILDERVNPEKVEFSDGGWTAVDWYNITDGGMYSCFIYCL